MNTTTLARPTRLNKVSPESLKERTYRELRRALMMGQFAPGEAVTVRSLSEAMEIGIMPVRESVQRLVTEGALTLTPNRTVRVPELSQAAFEEIWIIRIAVEQIAAAKAAVSLSAEDLQFIEAANTALEAAIAIDDPDAMIASNGDFHFRIYEGSGYSHVVGIIEMLWLRTGPLLVYPFRAGVDLRKSFTQRHGLHATLIDALRERKPDQAAATITQIIETSADWYRRHYPFPA
jgi:DNA-binding GntR family transcriptional regulator